MRVGQELAREIPAKVCVVTADRGQPPNILLPELIERFSEAEVSDNLGRDLPGSRLAKNLWMITLEEFLGGSHAEISVLILRDRLAALRRNFEYAVIHAAPALHHGDTALLGQVTDGVVLVLNAEKTRRVAALRAKAVLRTANARLVGMVLNRREFPIPERLYRRF